MANVELQHLLSKVSTIQTNLGVPSETLLKNRDEDEFNSIKIKVAESINLLSKKQEERDDTFNKNGRGIGVIRLGVEIQDIMTDIDIQLEQMKDTIRRQKKNPKKYPESQMEIKEQQYEKYKSLADQLRAREEGDTVLPEDKPLTIMDLKLNLTGKREQQQRRIDVDRQLNDIEVEAMQRWKENDQKQDAMLDQINVGLDGLKGKAEMIGDALDNQKGNIKGLEIEIEKTTKEIESSNQRLKKILYQYRKPNKFCMDVICVLLLLGLIAVIIKLAKN